MENEKWIGHGQKAGDVRTRRGTDFGGSRDTFIRPNLQIPLKRQGRGSENQSVSDVTTICLMQRDRSPLHRVDQAVDCGLWNVVPVLFNDCAKLLDIGGNRNTLSNTSIQSIPNSEVQSGEEDEHGEQFVQTHSFISCLGGWSQTIL